MTSSVPVLAVTYYKDNDVTRHACLTANVHVFHWTVAELLSAVMCRVLCQLIVTSHSMCNLYLFIMVGI